MDIISAVSDVQDALVAALDSASDGVKVEFGYPVGGPQPEHVWLSDEVSELTPSYYLTTSDGAPSGATFALTVRMLTTLTGTSAEIRDRLFVILAWLYTAVLPSSGAYLAGAATDVRLSDTTITPGLDGAKRFLGAEVSVAVQVGVVG